MNKLYSEPEYKVVEIQKEDVMTASVLEDASTGWEVTNPSSPTPVIPL